MRTTHSLENTLVWGKPSVAAQSKYRPIVSSGAVLLLTFVADLLWVTAFAENSPMQWVWGLALVLCLAAFIASLKSDCFRLSHYVVDPSGVQLQYEIATGPLETTKLFHRAQDWSGIASAAYLTCADEDGSETHEGVAVTLDKPIESGRSTIDLRSDCPERLMALVQSQLSVARSARGNAPSTLAIA